MPAPLPSTTHCWVRRALSHPLISPHDAQLAADAATAPILPAAVQRAAPAAVALYN